MELENGSLELAKVLVILVSVIPQSDVVVSACVGDGWSIGPALAGQREHRQARETVLEVLATCIK